MNFIFSGFFLLLQVSQFQVSDTLVINFESHGVDPQLALTEHCSLVEVHKIHTAAFGHTRPPTEQTARRAYLKKAIRKLVNQQEDHRVSWEVGLSFMADMSDEERAIYLTGFNESLYQDQNERLQNSRPPPQLLAGGDHRNVPDSFDGWMEQGYLRTIIPQKKGSCWAHTAVTPLEAQLAAKKRKFVKLSVQEIFDCGQESGHASGGNPINGWFYVYEHQRLTTDREVPEIRMATERGHDCSFYQFTSNALQGTELTNIYSISRSRVPYELEFVISSVSPVGVAVDSTESDLENYEKGIFAPWRCASTPDHAMTMTGYSPDYWIVRNSWANWGQNGYVFWSRTSRECHLLSYIRYPYLEAATPIQKRAVGAGEDQEI